MGSLTDPILKSFHESIWNAIYYSSRPNYQKVCEVLNGIRMDDMLDELWRISLTGHLDSLASFVMLATNVNIPRLRVAIGAVQAEPPADFDTLLRMLPVDQQRSIKNVIAVTQAPQLNPSQWSKYYWSVRSLPAPTPDAKNGDDDEAHLAADIATALTANAPRGRNPAVYTVTVVYRNVNGFKFVKGPDELTFLHEPNISVQISPDPNSKAAIAAAISLINLHVKRNWGLLKPDIEFSIGGQGGVTTPGGTPSGTVQAQVELHLTTTISLTATSSLGIGPAGKPGGPPDYGSFHTGNRDVDVAFTPFMIGLLGHWDPP